MDEVPHPFMLTLHGDRGYLAGFPLIVAVEVHNVSEHDFELLPFFDLFTVPGPVAFTLRGGGHEWTWTTMYCRREGEPDGVEFGPGKVWFALQDLSNLHPDIPPGHYQLSASLTFLGYEAKSLPLAIEVHESSKHDRAIAAKLRSAGDSDQASWRTFVEDNWSTPDATGLSEAAHAQLAFYLYLHRVTYGPVPIARLDLDQPWHFGHGVLEPAAALARLEIVRAAGKPEAAGIEAAVLERWPALAWWVDQIDKQAGPLTRLRAGYGVESGYARKDLPRPYESAKPDSSRR